MVKISSSVHTRLENAMELRKEVLETALRATELMQKIKNYKKENAEKKIMITKFKKEISELKGVVHELEFKDLPKEITQKLEPKTELKVKPAKEIEREVREEIEKPIVRSEMEQEIEDLRAKIENIKI